LQFFFITSSLITSLENLLSVLGSVFVTRK